MEPEKAKELLNKQIREISILKVRGRFDPAIEAWKYLTTQILRKIFSSNSPQIDRFNSINYSLNVSSESTSNSAFDRAFDDRLDEAEAILHSFIEEIDELGLESVALQKRKQPVISKDIFIVHGRDGKSVQELKLMLFEFGTR